MPRLRSLDLSHNTIGGHLPNDLSGCRTLTTLILSHNSFSGPLPSTLTKLRLTTLRVDHNQFDALPPGFFAAAGLDAADVSHNALAGPLDSAFAPAEGAAAPTLRVVDISGNTGVTGGLPAALGGYAALEEVRAVGVALSGAVPAALCRLANLRLIDAPDAFFTCPLPPQDAWASAGMEFKTSLCVDVFKPDGGDRVPHGEVYSKARLSPPTGGAGCCVRYGFGAMMKKCCHKYADAKDGASCRPGGVGGGVVFHEGVWCDDVRLYADPTVVKGDQEL